MDEINSWTDYRTKRMKELKALEENKGKNARDLMPIIAEEWKGYKQETEFISNYDEPEVLKEEKIEETQEPTQDDFKYQCGNCGHQFNTKTAFCSKCGIKLQWE